MDTKRTPDIPESKAAVFVTPSHPPPMRGIIAYEKPAGQKRFFLHWCDQDGRKIAHDFTSEATREAPG